MAQAIFIAYQPQEQIAFAGEAIAIQEIVWQEAVIHPYEMQHII